MRISEIGTGEPGLRANHQEVKVSRVEAGGPVEILYTTNRELHANKKKYTSLGWVEKAPIRFIGILKKKKYYHSLTHSYTLQ